MMFFSKIVGLLAIYGAQAIGMRHIAKAEERILKPDATTTGKYLHTDAVGCVAVF